LTPRNNRCPALSKSCSLSGYRATFVLRWARPAAVMTARGKFKGNADEVEVVPLGYSIPNAHQ